MLSPEKIIEYYHSKLNMLAEKVRGEEELVGNFIRIFPRPESKAIYNSICEDSGAERWDEGLSEMLFGKSSLEATQRDYEKFHEEMMDARKYGSTELLSDSTKRMLQTAFETVEKYLEPFYEDDPNPFPREFNLSLLSLSPNCFRVSSEIAFWTKKTNPVRHRFRFKETCRSDCQKRNNECRRLLGVKTILIRELQNFRGDSKTRLLISFNCLITSFITDC